MKFCTKCHQPIRKPIPKVRRRKTVRVLIDGVRTYPDGHQRCVTKAAWQKRREEAWVRDNKTCQHVIGAVYGICGKLLELSEAHIHHIRKRSVGRDDRLTNLITLCEDHHREIHERHP